jgi:hypothetical protein
MGGDTMFGSVVLDVAIGMAFVYLLLSLIATVVQEMLASFMQLRSANLVRGLRSLFSGDSLGAGLDLVDSVYNHGLVRGLYADPTRDLKIATFKWPLDWLRLRLRKVIGISPEKQVTVTPNPLLLPSYIPSRTFALAMIDILNVNKGTGEDAMRSITKSLADHHWTYRDNKAGEALYALALDAKNDVGEFQKNLEQWYNDAMDRVSGWYKRYTQTTLIVIGLILAVFFNVNSVKVARTLWLDRDARQALVNAAGSYAKDHSEQNSKTASTPEELKKQLQQNVGAFNDVTTSALLPVGWKHTVPEYWQIFNADRTDGILRVLVFLAGWLITAFAISFGAPFWFDTLNRFMVVRSTVKPQEKSTPEKSKG